MYYIISLYLVDGMLRQLWYGGYAHQCIVFYTCHDAEANGSPLIVILIILICVLVFGLCGGGCVWNGPRRVEMS